MRIYVRPFANDNLVIHANNDPAYWEGWECDAPLMTMDLGGSLSMQLDLDQSTPAALHELSNLAAQVLAAFQASRSGVPVAELAAERPDRNGRIQVAAQLLGINPYELDRMVSVRIDSYSDGQASQPE